MKKAFFFVAALALFVVSGCATHDRYPDSAGGSAYDRPLGPSGDSTGEYLGYPNYPQYRGE